MSTLSDILKNTPELNTIHFVGTDKNTYHCYVSNFYEKEFEKYKDKPISLLEIGISVGGSLYLWGKYFTKGTILGIDNTHVIRDIWKELPNVSYLIKDAYTQSVADSLQNFDIIIDDGPHSLESQIEAIKLYLPKLNDDGIFIIEDVNNVGYFEILKENTPKEFHDRIEMINLSSVNNTSNDLLFVIRK